MTSLSNKIAWRYLFAKKSTNAINLITGISVIGTMIGTASLILVLSVFNGFESVIMQMVGRLNPDINITPAQGKTFEVDSSFLAILQNTNGIALWSETLEETALFEYKGSQDFGTIKGVDHHFVEVASLDSVIREGHADIDRSDIHQGVLGSGLANKLGINIDDPLNQLTVFMPKRKKSKFSTKAFEQKSIVPIGIFTIQQEQDNEYVIASISMVRELLHLPNQVSALELKIKPDAQVEKIIRQLKEQLGAQFIIKDRISQNSDFQKIIRIEKAVSFVIFSLILLLVAFNLIGALWMIVLDKRLDIAVLKSMGVTADFIKNIFIKEGLLISGIGVGLGMLLAIILFALHQQFGLIPVQPNFILDRYPAELRWMDFLWTGIVVMAIGYLASILPARRAEQVEAYVREE